MASSRPETLPMETRTNKRTEPAALGILGWEAGNEDTLGQLEQLPGDIAHPDTFSFPVLYRRVTGACYETVVNNPSREVLAANIEAAQEMQAAGVGAVLTNCGFNAIFQRELAQAVDVPLFTSSLIQVPMVHRMLSSGQVVGIITADQEHLTPAHLRGVGITDLSSVIIRGIEKTGEFSRIRAHPDCPLDAGKFIDEVVLVGQQMIAQRPQVGAVVLECTDLPPAAAMLRRELGLAVFDIVTLAHMVHEALLGDRWGPK